MQCLFCFGQEKNYKPDPNIDFICSSCVQLLLNADQTDLRRAYLKAIEKGFTNKARAIESFLEEKSNEQTRPISKINGRCPNRKRINRPVRNEKKRIRRLEAKTQTAFL